ncbi:hypothetical protein ABH992_000252 [Bradyrhizobium yuanmingense]|uniref:Integrase catalytic domain-containing protein n=1 Tax=Bradyrhizobium yuanmingense TaxID=108015 RepID=A0ABV4G7G1_9BRAD
MNETLKAYCEAANIVFTRCRPYQKNDQAFVEQKNGAVVRRMVGYRRFEGLEAAKLLAELYRSARLFVNFFPTLVQIDSQAARRCACAQDIQRAGNTTSALGRRRPHARRGSRPSPRNLCRSRPGRVVARYPRRAGTSRSACGYPANRQSCCGIAIDWSLSGKSRLKSWRSEQANALLFVPTEKTPPGYEVTPPQ